VEQERKVESHGNSLRRTLHVCGSDIVMTAHLGKGGVTESLKTRRRTEGGSLRRG